MNTWRDECAPIIAEVIQRVGKSDMKLLRRQLRKAYPYYGRSHWPYRVWLSEIKRQLKLDFKQKADQNTIDMFKSGES